ncbi:hypothetical protein COL21_08240 [Bacillus thuringiensis]|uniref:hypothetical protein n=1 Tax=Bacillus thuringiensis TaxID=1428 RepID=UPI000BF779F4|nr:hypothetical protein [Bacillus thuringiensis]PFW00424.1 hypothetical protein COL21_08240 [Bacillus thuringiensis]
MSQEINKEVEALIRGWGLPEALKDKEGNVQYQFSGRREVNGHEQTYRCEDGDVKFCLYNKRNEQALFSMDFHKVSPRLLGLMNINEKPITLQFLYVIDDSLRNKGIASFYVKKLQEYACDEGMDCINVVPYADLEISKNNKRNALSQTELKKFYGKLSTPEMPIKLNLI